jgi:hypothetical protein
MGAVYKPGRAMINERNPEERTHQLTQLSGDFADGRFLTTALKGAGGIRPDADVSAVKLVRSGEVYSFDISGIFTGEPFKDVPLIDGDQVIVHSLDHYQPELMHLSPITPPGFTVFSSKLVEPSPSNSQATVAQAISVPYGTRLLRGLIAANCVGGIQTTKASRYAILVSTNLLTEQVFVIERSIDELIENADDFQTNPYLMPDDGIACYDSNTTNVRDAAKTIVEILTPLGLIGGLL